MLGLFTDGQWAARVEMLQHLQRAAADRQFCSDDPLSPVVAPVHLRKEACHSLGGRVRRKWRSRIGGGRGAGFPVGRAVLSGSARSDHVATTISGRPAAVNGSDRSLRHIRGSVGRGEWPAIVTPTVQASHPGPRC